MKSRTKTVLCHLMCVALLLMLVPVGSLPARAQTADHSVAIHTDLPADATVDAIFVYGSLDDGVSPLTATYHAVLTNGVYTATVPSVGKYIAVVSYTVPIHDTYADGDDTAYHYGSQVFYVTKTSTDVSVATDEVNIDWTDANAVYDETESFNHISFRVYGAYTDDDETNLLETHHIRLDNASVTVSYPQDSEHADIAPMTITRGDSHYEWRETDITIYKDAVVSLTCDIVNTITGDCLYKDFSIKLSGAVEFTQAIINCDSNHGLDFLINPASVLSVVTHKVEYEWEVCDTDGVADPALLAQLNHITAVPHTTDGYWNNDEHIVDTTWAAGIQKVVNLNDTYYLLTFQGWSSYSNGGDLIDITEDTIPVIDNTTVYGRWLYSEITTSTATLTLKKTISIPTGYEDYLDLSDMYFVVESRGHDNYDGDNYRIHISFSHMYYHTLENSADTVYDYDEDTGYTHITFSYTLFVSQKFDYTVRELKSDVGGFERSETITSLPRETDGVPHFTTDIDEADARVSLSVDVPTSSDQIQANHVGSLHFTSVYTKINKSGSIIAAPILRMHTTDADTGAELSGVEFTLVPAMIDDNGRWVADPDGETQTALTNAHGVASFSRMKPDGVYLLTETAAAQGYRDNNILYYAAVVLKDGYPTEQWNGDCWYTIREYEIHIYRKTDSGYEFIHYLHNYLPISNQKLRGTLTITNRFGEENAYTPDAVTVTVTAPDGTVTDVMLNADNAWTATLSDLSPGTYIVSTEHADVEHYERTSHITDNGQVTLDDGDVKDVTVTNTYTAASSTLPDEDDNTADGPEHEETPETSATQESTKADSSTVSNPKTADVSAVHTGVILILTAAVGCLIAALLRKKHAV